MTSHEEKYQFLLEKDGTHPQDLERKALFYILAGNYDLFEKKHFIYDFEEHSIIPECLESSYFSTSAKKLIELGFNHFNGYPADVNEVLRVQDNDNSILAIQSMEIRFGILKILFNKKD